MIKFIDTEGTWDFIPGGGELTDTEVAALVAKGEQTVWTYSFNGEDAAQLVQDPETILYPLVNVISVAREITKRSYCGLALPGSPDPELNILDYCIIKCSLFPQTIVMHFLSHYAEKITIQINDPSDVIRLATTVEDYGIDKLSGGRIKSFNRLSLDDLTLGYIPFHLTPDTVSAIMADTILFVRNQIDQDAPIRFEFDFSNYTPDIIESTASLTAIMGDALNQASYADIQETCRLIDMLSDATKEYTIISADTYYQIVAAYCHNNETVLDLLGVTEPISIEEALEIVPIPEATSA